MGNSRGGDKAKRGYVYVCRADNGMVKIGRSVEWKSRIHDLSSMLPYALRVLFVFECALSVEQYLHRQFDASRVRGEWFTLTAEAVNTISLHVVAADPEAEALEEEALFPDWVIKGLRKVQAKGILSMFDVVLYSNGVTIEFDVKAKIRALLALAKYHQIPREKINEAMGVG